MKMTLQRAENLVHVKQRYGNYLKKNHILIYTVDTAI